MNWSPELPKEPGDYAWRQDLTHRKYLTEVWMEDNGEAWAEPKGYRIRAKDIGGFWLKLVPADECVPKQWLEEAWDEGLQSGISVTVNKMITDEAIEWDESLAKRRMEN